MTGGGSDDPTAAGHHETRSEVSGSAGEVVQARDVQGGVHFHHTTGHVTEPTPQQLPGDVRGFVDRARELDHLDRALAEDRNEPSVVSVSVITALTIAREYDNHSWAAHWSVEFARVQRALGDPAESLASYQYAVSVQRRLGDRSREAMALDGTGEAYRELGRAADAIDFHRQAVRIHRELGDEWQWGIALDNLATALAETGANDDAVRQWGAALASLANFDDPRAAAMRDRISARLE